jgi:hypothetical protein
MCQCGEKIEELEAENASLRKTFAELQPLLKELADAGETKIAAVIAEHS